MAKMNSINVASFTTGLGHRLREVQNSNDWTVQEMAAVADIPKRSLENYMRREDPQYPGIEAVAKMAIGYRVSMDWLVLGPARHANYNATLIRVCARAAALPYIRSLIDHNKSGNLPISDHTVLGLSPKSLAQEIANSAAERSKSISVVGGAYEAIEIAADAWAEED